MINVELKNLNPKLKKMLHYILKTPKKKTKNPPVFILMHGIGGNEKMLSFLASQLPDDFLIFLLRAPYPLEADNYSWFQVDFSDGIPVINFEDFEKSQKKVIQFIEYISTQYEFDKQQIYLGGFSQGGEMAYSVGLTRPDLLKGIVVFSSRIAPEIQSITAADEALRRLKIFIYHGANDMVIPAKLAQESVKYLQKIGVQPIYKETGDKHRINIKVFEEINRWLKE